MAEKKKKTVDADTLEIHKEGKPVDLYVKIGPTSRLNKKHQFYKMHSEVYDCEEYVWRGRLIKGKKISFMHGDKTLVPNPESYNQISGPGITLNGGEAVADLAVHEAISCPVEGEDISYNFFSEGSYLIYNGNSRKLHTLFLRIYDNNNGNDNDRWLVISME